jgi:hypothetical protein
MNDQRWDMKGIALNVAKGIKLFSGLRDEGQVRKIAQKVNQWTAVRRNQLFLDTACALAKRFAWHLERNFVKNLHCAVLSAS